MLRASRQRYRHKGELILDEKARKRFFEKVAVNPKTGCWEWWAYRDREGYGRFRLDGKTLLAHRVSYEMAKGKIPEVLQIDHLCRVRACVNPDHLETVTGKENLHRGEAPAAANRAKTHCIRGHELSGDNLYVYPDGRRSCKACQAEYHRRRRAKKKKKKKEAKGERVRWGLGGEPDEGGGGRDG